ncbi:hypothetical protein ABZ759_27580 [Streptomyces sp. NPDC047860]
MSTGRCTCAGTVEGALRSARRAAAALLADLNRPLHTADPVPTARAA